jgi:hypothetical protein
MFPVKRERKKALWSESITDYNNNMETAGELNFMLLGFIEDYVRHHKYSIYAFVDVELVLDELRLDLHKIVKKKLKPELNKKQRKK